MKPLSLFFVTTAALFAACGQLLFKVGAAERERLIDFINPAIVGGLAFYGLGTAMWIYTLSSEKLVNVYAFTALAFVLVYLGGVVILGETITRTGVLGVLMILTGLFLLTTSNA